jgi:two-component system sensor histidine kinase TctE
LVNQLLALARTEPAGLGSDRFTRIDLRQLAQECTLEWVQMALEKDIDLGYEASDRALPLLCDAPSLGEMLNNLIDNAIRYTPHGGHITVGTAYTPGYAMLCVEDNGPGIAPEHRARVFERFYRVLGSGQSGSGLGLSIVAEVAKRHGAELTLSEGTDAGGTRICVRFKLLPQG